MNLLLALLLVSAPAELPAGPGDGLAPVIVEGELRVLRLPARDGFPAVVEVRLVGQAGWGDDWRAARP